MKHKISIFIIITIFLMSGCTNLKHINDLDNTEEGILATSYLMDNESYWRELQIREKVYISERIRLAEIYLKAINFIAIDTPQEEIEKFIRKQQIIYWEKRITIELDYSRKRRELDIKYWGKIKGN